MGIAEVTHTNGSPKEQRYEQEDNDGENGKGGRCTDLEQGIKEVSARCPDQRWWRG